MYIFTKKLQPSGKMAQKIDLLKREASSLKALN